MKKILSLAMALVMMMAVMVPAFAANLTANPDAKLTSVQQSIYDISKLEDRIGGIVITDAEKNDYHRRYGKRF